MRTRRSPLVDQRQAAGEAAVAGPFAPAKSRKAWLMRKMISRWRGSTCCISDTGQVSERPGISVWLV